MFSHLFQPGFYEILIVLKSAKCQNPMILSHFRALREIFKFREKNVKKFELEKMKNEKEEKIGHMVRILALILNFQQQISEKSGVRTLGDWVSFGMKGYPP